jgi:hypothetical protein
MAEATIENVIALFVNLRSQKERIVAKAKSETDELDKKMAVIEAHLLTLMEKDGVDSFKTGSGTAYKTTQDFANIANWDDFIEHVKRNNAWNLLEKRVSKTAVRGYLEEDQPVPPGVNYGTRVDVVIRKPST